MVKKTIFASRGFSNGRLEDLMQSLPPSTRLETGNRMVKEETPSPISSRSPPSRTRSNGSIMSGSVMEGCLSPADSAQPDAQVSATPSQQLPPSCGAKQLAKLKRFLTTLQQFGTEISTDIGERVRSLVLALVNSQISIEEFHSKLQETTNFPLKPFVIPFLKATLPCLQRELVHCAQVARQSPQQYLSSNERALFEAPNTHSPINAMDSQPEVGERKRASPPSHNPIDFPPAKRLSQMSPSSLISAGRFGSSPHMLLTAAPGPIRLDDFSKISRSRIEAVDMSRSDVSRCDRPSGLLHRTESLEAGERLDEEWKHIDGMLTNIVGMVDQTRRAISALQERSSRDRDELSQWMRNHAEGLDNDVKKRTSEMVSHTIKQTEDRVAQVKRRAEEAVNEVKRQAIAELQKAVAATELKANELITQEKQKMERSLQQMRAMAREEALQMATVQEDSTENCWNCGRKANETCSGCNVARYCGSFCQHKDWDRHHKLCGRSNSDSQVQPEHNPKSSSDKNSQDAAL